jgi:serine/threonine protein kinase
MLSSELLLLFEFGTAAFHRASSFLHAWSLRLPADGSCCLMLVMSKAAGSLDDLARGGGLGYDDCLGVFFRVAEALAYVHAAGTLHHDLHSGNVLMFQVSVKSYHSKA